MIWKGLLAGFVLLGAASVWVGCQTAVPKTDVVCQSDQIRAGDKLTLSFLDIPDAMPEKEFEVRSDGALNLPLNISVHAVGKNFSQLEREIRTNYVPRFYQRMTVIIKPGNRFYSVAGEVKQPGQLLYLGQTTVVRAITSAGDFTDFASRRKVQITRANGQTEVIDCIKARKDPRYDRSICPGDHINVPRSL